MSEPALGRRFVETRLTSISAERHTHFGIPMGGLVELQRAEIDERKASDELACLIMLDPDHPAFGGVGFVTYRSQ